MTERPALKAVTVKAPFELRALLATMKSAKEQRVNMAIWDRDIKAVEDAIETIEAVRNAVPPLRMIFSTSGEPARKQLGGV